MADDEFRRVLTEWATGLLKARAGVERIVGVDTLWDEGFGGSDVTPPDEPHLSIVVRYVDPSGAVQTHELMNDTEQNTWALSALLRELFAVAERTETA